MAILREERIGNQRLILGDCLQVMPMLGRFDAVVTDPPYGIGVDRAMAAKSGTRYGKSAAPAGHYKAQGWDDKPIGEDHVNAITAAAKSQIIFGGNYFALPPARCWLIWDKENGGTEFADCEMAWTNLDKPVRLLRWMWNGMIRKGHEVRHGHPTQKPVALMEWCLGFLPDAKTILDPFMGSGTTLVACQRMGRHGTGIELDPDYFAIACRRVEEAARQPDLLIPETRPQPTQEAMDL